ncbi:angiomotin-like 2a isoform X2 [Syngnathoides biaculeatus]|uniref:angiomotin-like 2a isoform X2 n=1 Tax=Syngnathoides biaculeatus TaxID=300417 RepID=UPI002ADD682F|nr:angiomotin-like 2a isoform X2 [Syngnathoides biaculeatus]
MFFFPLQIPCDLCRSSSPPDPGRRRAFSDMRTAEATPGTVLHRLIREQLRFGNLTDTRALLAIQQQALRGSGGSSGSPRSSLESLTQDECQQPHMSARQDPQGQEYHGGCVHLENPSGIPYHKEELPTYEEARVHSQYLKGEMDSGVDVHWDAKREHARSLSERLMRLSLERSPPPANVPAMSSSQSFPQLYNAAGPPRGDPLGPPPVYPAQEPGVYFLEPTGPTPFYSQHRNAGVPARGASGDEGDALRQENRRLRQQVDIYAEKAARLQKLEDEIARISEAYETLMKGSAKREALEKTMRTKLEAQMKRMQEFNRDLREQVCAAAKQRADKEAESSEHKQHVFLKLLEQNEEQQRSRERLERSVQNLRLSAEESQRGRELLEKALLSAHARNRHLEDELRRKRAYVEKVERLQSSLGHLQAACEKREELEMRLRTRLEQELKSMRAQQNQTLGPVASELSSSRSLQQLREREERILALEADITKWEQKYLEESTMRHFAMDAAATAAAQRDTTIINNSPGHSPDSSFNEDLPLTNHRHQEMESRIRALHAQLLEKDAMIKVLQQRSKWEHSKLEKQSLRLATSVPSVAVAAGSTETKGKSLSDDKTGGPVLRCERISRDSSTQCDPLQPSGTLAVCASGGLTRYFGGNRAERSQGLGDRQEQD